jgi:hypothetical protein
MSQLTTHSILHSWLSCFITWIKPDPNKKEDNSEKGGLVTKNVKQNAETDDLEVTDTPEGGSDAKGTGLRRHYRGHSEVDGYDIDRPFVVKEKDKNGNKVEDLLNRFEGYVMTSYPNSVITPTNSSVNLKFSNDLYFDIVPMFATDKAEEQILVKRDGTKIRTSIQKHNEFVRKRTRLSKDVPGRVKFNECVRAVKWWKEFQSDNSYYLSYDEATGKDNRPPSALIDWLTAYAYDHLGVEKTYAETLAKWFGFLADIIRNKKPVYFTDYYAIPSLEGKTGWIVLDPVNPDNNITGKWDSNKLNEFSAWFEKARDSWSRIIRYDLDGEENLAMEELVKLFGNPFKNHCEED